MLSVKQSESHLSLVLRKGGFHGMLEIRVRDGFGHFIWRIVGNPHCGTIWATSRGTTFLFLDRFYGELTSTFISALSLPFAPFSPSYFVLGSSVSPFFVPLWLLSYDRTWKRCSQFRRCLTYPAFYQRILKYIRNNWQICTTRLCIGFFWRKSTVLQINFDEYSTYTKKQIIKETSPYLFVKLTSFAIYSRLRYSM